VARWWSTPTAAVSVSCAAAASCRLTTTAFAWQAATAASTTKSARSTATATVDGNGDGTPGDDYQTQFDFRSSGAAILSLPDFMRGPGQAVDVPATGKRLPVSMTSAGGLRSLVFTIDYDPRLLAINGAQPAAGLPPGSELRFETAARDSGGQRARVTVILPGETTLAAGTVRLVDLVAEVPASAPYGAKQILALAVEQVNGASLWRSNR